jgi:hypothetical protein
MRIERLSSTAATSLLFAIVFLCCVTVSAEEFSLSKPVLLKGNLTLLPALMLETDSLLGLPTSLPMGMTDFASTMSTGALYQEVRRGSTRGGEERARGRKD